jgi:hypothetical protein
MTAGGQIRWRLRARWMGLLALSCVLGSRASGEIRPWTPESSVTAPTLGSVADSHAYPSSPTEAILVSPDKRAAVFVVSWGDLQSDESCASLNVAVFSPDGARMVKMLNVTRRSRSSIAAPISLVTWQPDGRCLFFVSSPDTGRSEVWRLDLADGREVKVAECGEPVTGLAGCGDTVVCELRLPASGLVNAAYPGHALEPDARTRSYLRPRSTEMVAFRGGKRVRIIGEATLRNGFSPVISADGRSALWTSFRDGHFEYHLVDLERGTGRTIAKAVSRHSRTVRPRVLPTASGVFLLTSPEGENSAGQVEVVVMSFEHPQLKVLGRFPIDSFDCHVDARGEGLVISAAGRSSHLVERSGSLECIELNAAEKSGISPVDPQISIEESGNSPPRIRCGETIVELSQLAKQDEPRAKIAKQSDYTWNEGGITVHGGLTLPADETLRPPYPLIIQNYYYEPAHFRPDGPVRGTCYATQALAARGFAVLQVNSAYTDPAFRAAMGTPQEGPLFVARIEAAVNQLASEGTVDRNKIGLSGFSRGGYLTFFAATHPGTVPIKAVISADSYTGTLPEYLVASAAGGDMSVNGSGFWSDESTWRAQDPLFSLDRMPCALLRTVHRAYSPWFPFLDLQLIGAAMATGTPLEYLVFPEGDHQLRRPAEQLLLMTTTLDWFDFWIQDREDTAPEKQGQYRRWRLMRAALEARSGKTSGLLRPVSAAN